MSSENLPVTARVEIEPEVFERILRQKRNFESLVRSNFLKRSKLDLTRIPSAASEYNVPSNAKEPVKDAAINLRDSFALDRSNSKYV